MRLRSLQERKKNKRKKKQTHRCLCFGFLLQIIYTYFPFFLLTLLHPSHSFLTELRTFMPRVCCCCDDDNDNDNDADDGACLRAQKPPGNEAGVFRRGLGTGWHECRARAKKSECGGEAERSVRRRSGARSVGDGMVTEGEGGVGRRERCGRVSVVLCRCVCMRVRVRVYACVYFVCVVTLVVGGEMQACQALPQWLMMEVVCGARFTSNHVTCNDTPNDLHQSYKGY